MYMYDQAYDIDDIYESEINKILGDDTMKSAYGFTRFDTEDEFKNWLKNKSVSRTVNRLQIHHTGSPSYSNFFKSNGTHEDELTRQKNMKSFHVNSRGMSDIAQHFTVFPNGKIVTGRSLNSNPAGITGWNTGAICVEIYGNFDKGQDTMKDAQKKAVIMLYGELCKKFKLTPSTNTIRCHAWFTSGGTYLGDYYPAKSRKSCPGTAFMGFGNSKSAIANNFIPLVKNYISGGTTSTSTSNSTSSLGVYRVNVDELNVRQGPGTSYPITTVVHKGEAFTVTKMSGNWGKLKSGAGWINCSSRYCTKVR